MENLEQSNKKMSLSLVGEYGCSDSDGGSESGDDTPSTSMAHEESVELSEMVLKNNIINACAHGPLDNYASALVDAGVDKSRHMIIDSGESAGGVVEYEVTVYREGESDSSSGSDSSDVDSVKDVEELSSSDDEGECGWLKPSGPPRVRGELALEQLPPIEDLTISLPEQQCTRIGTVYNMVDKLVIVKALPETPAVDLDTVLFLEKGARALGKVFDVFGPVTEPYYCVRFNSAAHITERRVESGMEVYIAPKSDHTNYVFISQLMRMKGSDASWLNDIEPPAGQVEYSDDEEERRANKARKEKNRRQQDPETGDAAEASDNNKKNKPVCHEQRMNMKNIQRSSEASSRFGGGPSSRNRNPFSAGSRRNGNPNPFARFTRPPPGPEGFPRSGEDPGGPVQPMNVPPMFGPPRSFPPMFNTRLPPAYAGYRQWANPLEFPVYARRGPPPYGGARMPMFRPDMPVFGSNFTPQPPWFQNSPPPPGT